MIGCHFVENTVASSDSVLLITNHDEQDALSKQRFSKSNKLSATVKGGPFLDRWEVLFQLAVRLANLTDSSFCSTQPFRVRSRDLQTLVLSDMN